MASMDEVESDGQKSVQATVDEYDSQFAVKQAENVAKNLVTEFEALDSSIARTQLRSAVNQAETVLSQKEGWIKVAIEYVSALAKKKAVEMLKEGQQQNQPGGGGDEPDSAMDVELKV